MNKILLFGNPNAGKTTIFNKFTHASERISNFEGSTVQKKTKLIKGTDITLVDVPGTYGLANGSQANDIAIATLLSEDYSKIIDVIEISNIKKNLYLMIDLLETQKKVDIVLTKNDIFNGDFDQDKFKKITGINTYLTSSNQNMDKSILTPTNDNSFKIDYHPSIESSISKLIPLVDKELTNGIDSRFFVIQLYKGNINMLDYFTNKDAAQQEYNLLCEEVNETAIATSLSGAIFNARRNFIIKLLDEVVVVRDKVVYLRFLNEQFDKVALHKFWGFVVFAIIMYIVFYISFYFTFLTPYIESAVASFSDLVVSFMSSSNIPDVIISLVQDGIIAGIGGVFVFIPQIIILFALMTVLESIGYLPRISALFENLFSKLGISAHSLIPYISGLGCNILGIMSTKTINNEKKRIATILTLPFISCSARFPIYILFINIFFDNHQALILLFLYALGCFVAVAYAFVLSKFVYKDTEETNIISLPRYNAINFKYLYIAVSKKIKNFLKHAGGVILIGSIVIWFLTFIGPKGYTQDITESFIYPISSVISHIFIPLGFGTVEATSSLISSFMAKELAVSSMNVMYGADSLVGLTSFIQADFTYASAMSFMVYSLLFIPCLATLGAIYTETKKLKYVFISAGSSLVIGYVLAFITYNLINIFI